jgi:hypothetical protein
MKNQNVCCFLIILIIGYFICKSNTSTQSKFGASGNSNIVIWNQIKPGRTIYVYSTALGDRNTQGITPSKNGSDFEVVTLTGSYLGMVIYDQIKKETKMTKYRIPETLYNGDGIKIEYITPGIRAATTYYYSILRYGRWTPWKAFERDN